MPLRISQLEHSIFARNFLQSVICQIKVQPIFLIASEVPPADFQNLIRKEYPIVKKEKNMQVDMLGGNFKPTSLGNTWRFLSEDNLWQVTLDAAFISIECKNYKNFADFRQKFEVIYDAYITTYTPSRPERIGLRYINLVRPINVRTLSDWTKWIKPELFGMIGDNTLIQEPIIHDFKELQTIQEPGNLILKHGLMRDHERSQFYLLDIDRYIMGAKNHSEVSSLLNRFNTDCYNIFIGSMADEGLKWLKGEK